MKNPIQTINQWLQEEQAAGAPNPQQAILCTTTPQKIPHGRVIAIREINEQGLVFFTQKGTRKVGELTQNHHASLIFWFELRQREIIIEGTVTQLSTTENQHYWQSYPREAQIRFHSYAPTSSQPIPAKQLLEDRRKQIALEYSNALLPMSEFYYGFRIHPERLVFYSYHTDELSDVMQYTKVIEGWNEQLLSP